MRKLPGNSFSTKEAQVLNANKNACKHCTNENKCYKGKNDWKEIDFTKDQQEKSCRDWLKAEGKEAEHKASEGTRKHHYRKVKVVKFFLNPDRKKTAPF